MSRNQADGRRDRNHRNWEDSGNEPQYRNRHNNDYPANDNHRKNRSRHGRRGKQRDSGNRDSNTKWSRTDVPDMPRRPNRPFEPSGPSEMNTNRNPDPRDRDKFRGMPSRDLRHSPPREPRDKRRRHEATEVVTASLPTKPSHADFADRSKMNFSLRPLKKPRSGPVGSIGSVGSEPNSLPAAPQFKKSSPECTAILAELRASSPYQRVAQVGEGTYGKVYKACNPRTGELVALKKLRLDYERDGFPITALREVSLLQALSHRNIVALLEMMVEGGATFMVLEYCGHDLAGLLSHPHIRLRPGHVANMAKQLVEGMSYIHEQRVLHRDIKASNILVNNTGELKITDFGLARKMRPEVAGQLEEYTNRVITLWYRPPELLLGETRYGTEVDAWGVGCLFVELFTRKPIFQGQNEIEQLELVFEIMGGPDVSRWPGARTLPWFNLLQPATDGVGRWKEVSAGLPEEAADLAAKFLRLNPRDRLGCREALNHPYFEKFEQEPLDFLHGLTGEWHELESKRARKKRNGERSERMERTDRMERVDSLDMRDREKE